MQNLHREEKGSLSSSLSFGISQRRRLFHFTETAYGGSIEGDPRTLATFSLMRRDIQSKRIKRLLQNRKGGINDMEKKE